MAQSAEESEDEAELAAAFARSLSVGGGDSEEEGEAAWACVNPATDELPTVVSGPAAPAVVRDTGVQSATRAAVAGRPAGTPAARRNPVAPPAAASGGYGAGRGSNPRARVAVTRVATVTIASVAVAEPKSEPAQPIGAASSSADPLGEPLPYPQGWIRCPNAPGGHWPWSHDYSRAYVVWCAPSNPWLVGIHTGGPSVWGWIAHFLPGGVYNYKKGQRLRRAANPEIAYDLYRAEANWHGAPPTPLVNPQPPPGAPWWP